MTYVLEEVAAESGNLDYSITAAGSSFYNNLYSFELFAVEKSKLLAHSCW